MTTIKFNTWQRFEFLVKFIEAKGSDKGLSCQFLHSYTKKDSDELISHKIFCGCFDPGVMTEIKKLSEGDFVFVKGHISKKKIKSENFINLSNGEPATWYENKYTITAIKKFK